ncbi:MAG: hypothetical protein HN712_04875 [Gemmatimonadetes bacterium]|jgi:hypothetical protein|nr:hypothetical protein [Gemmatimonadota bacterium]MBT7859620.1 hypothetical protein [Gemmatimonadota bacterium]
MSGVRRNMSRDTSRDVSRGVTPRAVLFGLVLVGVISVMSPWAILVVKGSQLTSNAIPIIAIFLLFLVTVVLQPILRWLGKHGLFTRPELITIYVMMLVGSVVVTTGFTGTFLSVITGAVYYATPENDWSSLFIPYLSRWLTPEDTEAIRLFYEGLPRGQVIPWAAWTLPLISWLSFILVFYWSLFCMATLLRGQWVENERLVFPLTRLPLAMVEEPDGGSDGPGLFARLFTSRIMWMGFAIPLFIHSWNSAGNYTDAFQRITLNGTVAILPGLMSVPFRLNLPVLGLAYLMPLNVSFSVWFFFIIGMLQQLIFARIGIQIGTGDIWNSGGTPPSILHQAAGGMFVFVLFLLWTARGHLRGLWSQARGHTPRDPREVMAPALAFGGLAVGYLLLLAWLITSGLSFYVAFLLLTGALGAFIGLSRIVAEAGLPGCQTPMVPQAFITRGFGPEVLGLKNMTGLGLSTVWIGETAANMMNAVVHALKLTTDEDATGRYRGMPIALGLAIVVGLAGSIWFTMEMAYTYGGINLHSWYYGGAPRWPFDYMKSVYGTTESFLPRLGFTSIGGGVMAILLVLRHRFIWWPLHPIGFPIAQTYTIVSYGWLSILLAWMVKSVILRYGGISVYRAIQPFFLGLILGEFATACLWTFLDGTFGFEGNMIFNF